MLEGLLSSGITEVFAKRSRIDEAVKAQKLAIGERWTDEHTQCFQELKRIIANTVTLAYPNPEHKVCLFTDASDKHRFLLKTLDNRWLFNVINLLHFIVDLFLDLSFTRA